MKKEFRRDNRLRQLNKKREKCRNTMNNHHLVPESRGGNKSPSNMLMISVWKHDCWHELFKNRTINEIKNILSGYGAKFAEQGSVRWAFLPPSNIDTLWQPKFKQELSLKDQQKFNELIEALEEQNDVQKISTNA